MDNPGGKVYRVQHWVDDVGDTVSFIQADYLTFEPGHIAFWLGLDGRVKELKITIPSDKVTQIEEVKLEGEYRKRWQAYQNHLLTDFTKDFYDHYINPRTGETMKELRQGIVAHRRLTDALTAFARQHGVEINDKQLQQFIKDQERKP